MLVIHTKDQSLEIAHWCANILKIIQSYPVYGTSSKAVSKMNSLHLGAKMVSAQIGICKKTKNHK